LAEDDVVAMIPADDGDVVAMIHVQVLAQRCGNAAPHNEHRFLDSEFLSSLNTATEGTVYECPGATSEKLDRQMNVTLTAAELFIVTCAVQHEYSEAYQHGTRWKRICGDINLPDTGLTYEDVAGDD
jgi:hypothetical protein